MKNLQLNTIFASKHIFQAYFLKNTYYFQVKFTNLKKKYLANVFIVLVRLIKRTQEPCNQKVLPNC